MIINILLSACYFCLDTKVTKKSRKSEASAHKQTHPRLIFWPTLFPAIGGINNKFHFGCSAKAGFDRIRQLAEERVLATKPFSLVRFFFGEKRTKQSVLMSRRRVNEHNSDYFINTFFITSNSS